MSMADIADSDPISSRTFNTHSGMAQRIDINNVELQNPLKIASFNVRGFKNAKKRSTVLRNFLSEKIDVVAMQETHLSDESEINHLRSQWGGTVHYSFGTNRSKGLVTLFNKSIEDKDVKLIFKTERILVSSVLLESEKFIIINVYCHCVENEKKSFFDNLQGMLFNQLGDDMEGNVICMGDFNVTINQLDIISGSAHRDDVRKAFIDAMNSLSLVDSWRLLHPTEKAYSWSRCNPPAARRLDYIFVSESLASSVRHSIIKGIGFSDHRLVVSIIDATPFKYGKGLYKLNTSLLTDINYCDMIVNQIKTTSEEYKDINPHLKWEMIKVNVKESSQQYSRFKASEKAAQQSILCYNLNILEQKLVENPLDKELLAQISKSKSQLEINEMERTRGAQIRSGLKWIEEGEKGTKYFLSLEKSRSKSNTIKRLKNNEGICISNESKIVEEIGNFYEQIYNSDNSPPDFIARQLQNFVAGINLPKLDELDARACDEKVTEDEVAAALKSMQHGSSPGCDGLPVEFYKLFWQHLKKPLVECYEFSFNENILSPSERVGVISLFHKGKDLSFENLNNWRPISLTNVDYKILAKALSLRLNLVIDKLIGPQQTGFLKGRHISTTHKYIDDILLLQRFSKSPGILLALDFKQAFDSIKIPCIIKALNVFGFGPTFTKWIEILNNDRLSCVKNGGYLSRNFSMQNGVRQGCPISPQLFILAVELLAQKIIQDRSIKGLKPVSDMVAFKVCQYADDTTLGLKNEKDLRKALLHLEVFALCSGLLLNFNKSFALSTNGTAWNVDNNQLQFKDVVKILGVYFSNAKSASEIELNWTIRIDNIHKIFSKWSRRDLSIIGKLHVIKTFGLSQLVFIMQSVGIPKHFLEEINRLFFRFLWRRKYSNKRAYEKVKRKIMYTDHKSGGLNMINIFNFQDAIYLSWAESLLSSEHQNWKDAALGFFEGVGGRSVFRCSSAINKFQGIHLIKSPFWRTVLCKWLEFAGNNSKTHSSLNDPIFNNANVVYKSNTLFFPCCIRKGIVTLNDVYRDGRLLTMLEFQEIHDFQPSSILDYLAIYNALRNKLHFNGLRYDDNFYFRGEKIGKLGRRFFQQSLSAAATEAPVCVGFWKRKFNIDINSHHWIIVHQLKETRLRTLSWKITHNIFPTNILLEKMRIVNSINCLNCNEPDFIEHFFCNCRLVQPLWKELEKDIRFHLNVTVKLDEQTILLGFLGQNGITKFICEHINVAIAIGKMSISKFRYGKKRNLIEIYETECRLRNIWREC